MTAQTARRHIGSTLCHTTRPDDPFDDREELTSPAMRASHLSTSLG